MAHPASFEDHFSTIADTYALYRPTYPPAIFEWLAAQCPRHEAAWDCGTGSGQAAIGLVPHFQRILATDPAPEQLARALQHPKIAYSCGSAEDSGLPDASVDLVTAAVSLHWFDLERFYAEVRRIVRPGGIIAAWCYTRTCVTPFVDDVVEGYYTGTVGPFWPKERMQVESEYRNLPFPFEPLQPPIFELQAKWDLAHFVGYIGTWSATVHAAVAMGHDPLAGTLSSLQSAWGDPARVRLVRWPLGMLVGRVP